MKRIIVLLLLVLSASTNSKLLAQTNNYLNGTVVDKNTKQPVSGASVSIPDLHHTVLSDSNGKFRFSSLPAASYEVQVSMVGYKASTQFITIDGAVNANFELDATSTELNEVVITGTTKSTQIKKSPLPIIVVNKDYLATNISTNVIDAIAALPGVSAVTTGPNVSKTLYPGFGVQQNVDAV